MQAADNQAPVGPEDQAAAPAQVGRQPRTMDDSPFAWFSMKAYHGCPVKGLSKFHNSSDSRE